jgi:hypothetical protein
MPVIPATQEAEEEDGEFEASLGNIERFQLKTLKYPGAGDSGL